MYKLLAIPCLATLQIALDHFPAIEKTAFLKVLYADIAAYSPGSTAGFDTWITALTVVDDPKPWMTLMMNRLNKTPECPDFIEMMVARERRESPLATCLSVVSERCVIARREPLKRIFPPQRVIRMIVSVCNDSERRSPYGVYVFLARLAGMMLSVADLTVLFSRIDFDAHPHDATIPRAFYNEFSQTQFGFVDLAMAGVASRKMGTLITDRVTRDNPIQTTWIDRLLCVSEGTMGKILNEDPDRFFYTHKETGLAQTHWHLILTQPFLALGQVYAPKAADKPLFLKLFLYLTCGLNGSQQTAFMRQREKIGEIESIHLGLLHFYNKYCKNKETSTDYTHLYDMVAAKLVMAASFGYAGIVLKSLEKVLNVPVDYIDRILEHEGPIGEIASASVAIRGAFANVFQGDEPVRWRPESLMDDVERLYFQIKYPLTTYVSWVKRDNMPHGYIRSTDIDRLFQGFESKKKALLGYSQLVTMGYRYLQHGQAAAIMHGVASVLGSPGPSGGIAGKRTFFKLGTGQGKSLLLAMTALRLLEERQRVLIYTCYQNLASRDYDSFKGLYAAFGEDRQRPIATALQSDDSGVDFVTGHVVYANIDTHFFKFNRYLEERSTNQHDKPGVRDFYYPEAVLLDEFDALIIGSANVGRTVVDFNQSLFSLGVIPEETIRSASALSAFITTNSLVGDFFDQLSSLGLGSLYQRWHTAHAMDSRAPRSGLSALGSRTNYIGGTGYELAQGKLYGYAATVDPLVYFEQAHVLMGVSGSIDIKGINVFKEAYNKPETPERNVHYVEIPSFCGEGGGNVRRRELYNLPRNTWLSEVERSVCDALDKGQPVLVFGDYEASLDGRNENFWASLKQMLQRISETKHAKFQDICSEEDICDARVSNAVLAGYITLASKVAGRGVDFKPSMLVNKQGGLHVVVAYCPPDDPRLLIQMIGRSGRLDAPGSHAIVLLGSKPSDAQSVLSITDFRRDRHLISRHIVTMLCESDYDKTRWQRWVLLNLFMESSTAWPSDVQGRFRGLDGQQKGDYFWKNVIARENLVAPLEIDHVVNDGPVLDTEERDLEAANGISLSENFVVNPGVNYSRYLLFVGVLLLCGAGVLGVYYLMFGKLLVDGDSFHFMDNI